MAGVDVRGGEGARQQSTSVRSCSPIILGTRNEEKGISSVNHTDRFDIDEEALPLGVRALATLAWEFLVREP